MIRTDLTSPQVDTDVEEAMTSPAPLVRTKRFYDLQDSLKSIKEEANDEIKTALKDFKSFSFQDLKKK